MDDMYPASSEFFTQEQEQRDEDTKQRLNDILKSFPAVERISEHLDARIAELESIECLPISEANMPSRDDLRAIIRSRQIAVSILKNINAEIANMLADANKFHEQEQSTD